MAKVDLGCVLNDQPRSAVVTITNPSRVEARYTWCFASQQDTPKLFDVLPIRGLLLPGESQRAEILYKGGIDCKAKALALCEVAGGPEYELPMVAESSAIVYRLDKTLIDFGLQQYDRFEDTEMYVFNTGKVPVTFSVLLASLSRSNVLEVLPGSGRIAAGDKQRIAIRLLPGMPTKLREAFHIQVAHPHAHPHPHPHPYPTLTLTLTLTLTPTLTSRWRTLSRRRWW